MGSTLSQEQNASVGTEPEHCNPSEDYIELEAERSVFAAKL